MARIVDAGIRQLKTAASFTVDSMRRLSATVNTMLREGPTPRQSRQIKLIAVLVLLVTVLSATMAWIIAAIAADPSGFMGLVGQNPATAAVVYALINTLQVIVAVIPGEPLEVVAGYLFGTWGGLAVVSAGLALGEAIVFIAVKRHGMRLVRRFVSDEKLAELAFFNDPRRLNLITFLMMLIPGTPKDIVTYVVGLTPMSLGTWMGISIPARVLSIVSSTFVGDAAAKENWVVTFGVGAIIVSVSILGIVYYILISRQARQSAIIAQIGHDEWVASGSPTNDAASFTERDRIAHAELLRGPVGRS